MKQIQVITREDFKIKGTGIYECDGITFEVTEAGGGKYSGTVHGVPFYRRSRKGVESLVFGEKRERKPRRQAQEAQPQQEPQQEPARGAEEAQQAEEATEVPAEEAQESAVQAAKRAAKEAAKRAAELAQEAAKEAERAAQMEEAAKEAERREAEERAKKEAESKKEVRHRDFDKIKAIIEDGTALYLYGPAGSGKNVVCKQVADDLGIPFHFANSVTQEFKINGFVDAHGRFHETEFSRAFQNGGLFMLDELDCSVPEVLTLLNAAIANGYHVFENGVRIEAHPDFRVIAAGNTCGTGATEEYCSRVQLDAASLNRFAVRFFDYDSNIEEAVAGGDKQLLSFVRAARAGAKEAGLSLVVSYRNITMLKKFAQMFDAKEAVSMAVTKGMQADDILTLTEYMDIDKNNVYYKALKSLAE